MTSLNLSLLKKIPKNISTDSTILNGTTKLNFNNHIYATAFYGIGDNLTINNGTVIAPIHTPIKNYIDDKITAASLADITTAVTTTSFKKIAINAKGLVTGTAAVVQSDITGLLGNGSITETMLATSGVANGTYGSASTVPVISVTDRGRVTSVSNVAIAIAASQITSGTISTARLGTGIASTSNFLRGDGTWQTVSIAASQITSGVISTAYLGTGTASASNFLRGDGTWQTVSMPWDVKNTHYIAVAKDRIMVDTSSAPITITLPASPSVGDDIYIVDMAGTFGTNALTLTASALDKILGAVQDLVLDVNNQGATIIYSGPDRGWVLL